MATMRTQQIRRKTMQSMQAQINVLDALAALTSSTGFREFLEAIKVYRQKLMEELVTDHAFTMTDIARHQGAADICNHILSMPDGWQENRARLVLDLARAKESHQASEDGELAYGKIVDHDGLSGFTRQIPDEER